MSAHLHTIEKTDTRSLCLGLRLQLPLSGRLTSLSSFLFGSLASSVTSVDLGCFALELFLVGIEIALARLRISWAAGAWAGLTYFKFPLVFFCFDAKRRDFGFKVESRFFGLACQLMLDPRCTLDALVDTPAHGLTALTGAGGM